MPAKGIEKPKPEGDVVPAIFKGRPEAHLRQRGEQDRSIATRTDLIVIARQLFAARGFHATGTPDIVSQAQMTRGALYHHFGGKMGLFEDVFRHVARELLEEAQTATSALKGQTSLRIIATLRVHLELLASRQHYHRILLIDGPAVLGWERWRELRNEYEHPAWVMTLQMFKDEGVDIPAPLASIASLVMAAIADAALEVAHAVDKQEALDDAIAALAFVLTGLIKPNAA